ncbi:unnamed protein product [Polarella glacialis]|uniref:Uncharacterized protein n=1 Tax=Polarella glacialis TaxID=89957 RepID=A0A813KXL6_POLGL|nr:unnamed protein product [Polarella glacialis]
MAFGVLGGCWPCRPPLSTPAAAKPNRPEIVHLLQNESSIEFTKSVSPITTITFFKGAPPAQAIRDRVASILSANPWLNGQLHWNSEKARVVLRYSSMPSQHEVFQEKLPGELGVYADMPYRELWKACKGCQCCIQREGSSWKNHPGPLFRVTLIPDGKAPEKSFALVVSLIHLLGDVHTYYQIFNMLSHGAEVKSLRVARSDTWTQELCRAAGEDSSKAVHGLPWLMNFMRSVKRRQRSSICISRLDQPPIEQAEVPTVSTHDVLTSAFLRMVGADICVLPVDMRGRLLGISDLDAGNYTACLPFIAEQVCCPSQKQKQQRYAPWALNGSCTLSNSCFEARDFSERSRLAFVTDWSTFAEALILPACEQHFHQPLLDPRDAVCDLAIIFKSRPHELSVMIFTDPGFSKETLTEMLRQEDLRKTAKSRTSEMPTNNDKPGLWTGSSTLLQQRQQFHMWQPEPGSPKKEPGSPKKESGSPKKELGSPKKEPRSPKKEFGSPKKEPGSSKKEPGSPKKEPGAPKKEPGSPKKAGQLLKSRVPALWGL